MRVLMITPDFPVDKGGIQSPAGGLAEHLDVELEVATSPAAALATGLRRVPFVQYLHAQEIPVRPSLTRFAVRRPAATIAVSSHARALAAGIGCDPDPFRVIPPGIDIPDRGGRNVAGDRPTVLTIARFEVAYKGHDMMVEAMPSILARVPDAQWVLIGEGPLRTGIEQRAEELGIGNSVSFLGRVSDAERDRWLTEANAFAMPSRLPEDGTGEGFGIVFLEAAACGVPQIAGRSGGSADAVADGETGVVLDDPRDVDAVARAITAVLEPETNARMSAASRTRAVDVFDYDLLAAAMQHALSC